MAAIVLSRFQAEPLLAARHTGAVTAEASLDLGRTRIPVTLDETGITAADGTRLSWTQLEQVAASENGCFRLVGAELEEIKGYSEATRHTFRLLPTAEAPGLLLSGFTMHRFKEISPLQAAREMVKAAGPLHGRVLDTATGLGYTARE